MSNVLSRLVDRVKETVVGKDVVEVLHDLSPTQEAELRKRVEAVVAPLADDVKAKLPANLEELLVEAVKAALAVA